MFRAVLKIRRDTSHFQIALTVQQLVSTCIYIRSRTGPTTHYGNDTCASIRINILMDESERSCVRERMKTEMEGYRYIDEERDTQR